MNKVFKCALIISILITTSCKQKTAPPQSIPEVGVITIQPQRVVITNELPGRTSAYLVAEIRPQVNGLIQKRLFTEGSDVNAGEVLYQIDPAPFQAALDNASAALTKTESGLISIKLRFERYRDLLADKAISQQDYDDASAALKQGEAEVQLWKAMVQTAKINLGYTRVAAPISGRIGRSSVTDGAIVTAYQPTPLATIQQLNPIYVDVPQSTAELPKLRRRMQNSNFNNNGTNQNKVKILKEDGTPYDLEGTLQFQDVTVDPTTGSVILRIIVPNPQETLLPGMFVKAVVQEGVEELAILVPQQAVSYDVKGNPIALIVDPNNKVQMQKLTIDRDIGDKWLVNSGLKSGDRVIIEGLQKVRPGVPVKVTPLDTNSKNAVNPGKQNQAAGGA